MSRAAPFTPKNLLSRLAELPRADQYLVGYSGGADSTALLQALHEAGEDREFIVEAVHFNHGLHPEADAWQSYCEEFCAARNIPLATHKLNLVPDQSNLENTARELRYSWVEQNIGENTAYLTAHHADDRAETFLLNAFRGSGLDGLASIPEVRKLGQGLVLRPLLNVSRASLVTFLEQKNISWIDDPSNLENGPDRNFIRNEVLPLIESRWPASRHTLSRTAGHLQSGNRLLKQLLDESALLSPSVKRCLPVSILDAVEPQDASQYLKHWLDLQGTPQVPESRMTEYLKQLSGRTSESHCELSWTGWNLRLFRDDLILCEQSYKMRYHHFLTSLILNQR